MSKAIMIGVGSALVLGFLIACTVVGFALLSGSQVDLGYSPGSDVGADTIDSGSGFDTLDTTMGGSSADIGSDISGDSGW